MKITCPWCGTHYLIFQTNCTNCGGPLPAPEELPPLEQGGWSIDLPLPQPPPAPRSISGRFAWKLLAISGTGITGMVFLILGVTFGITGVGLLLVIGIGLFLGLVFGLLGLIFLGLAITLLAIAYQRAARVVTVLRDGQVARGRIQEVRQDLSVTLNNSHPYITTYSFEVLGATYHGRVTSARPPLEQYLPGAPATILYLPERPQDNALYPHP